MSRARGDGGAHAERFTLEALQAAKAVERISPLEHRASWSLPGHTGREDRAILRSGINLCASHCRWEQPLSVGFEHAPSEIDFMVSRGPGVRVTTEHGDGYLLAGGTLQVSQVKRPVNLRFDSLPGAPCRDAQDEIVHLGIGAARLNELLGASTLPTLLSRMLAKDGAYLHASRVMTPGLFRLLDEILYCDAKGASRQLYLEAKGLELLALMIDEFEEAERAAASRLSQPDVQRLQCARKILLARVQSPPSLPELARQAGLNEAKLKAGFRQLFGNSVFAYLRQHRMEEARRLLRTRKYSVTEVALRVGYSNPSKFAAAFRKQFGIRPSAVG